MLAWFFGLGKYLLGISWVYIVVHEHGDTHWFLSALLILGFTAIFALTTLVVGAIYHSLMGLGDSEGKFRQGISVLVFGIAWMSYEWLLSWMFGGFPWLLAGYITTHTPIYGLASIGGVSLNSVLVVALASCIVVFYRPKQLLLIAVVVLALIPIAQIQWVQPVETIKVGVVQASTAIAKKWDRNQLQELFDHYLNQSLKLDADLVVWPETALPVSVEYTQQLLATSELPKPHPALLLGQFDIQKDSTERLVYNSLVLFSNNAPHVYRKQVLVPFGEYVPFANLIGPILDFFQFPMNQLVEGGSQQPALKVGSFEIVPTICFEVIFPWHVKREMNKRTGDLLVNVSEDAWFGNSIGPHQHFQVARMRAVEHGRYLIRAANRGISAVVSPTGEVIREAAATPESAFSVEVNKVSGQTPYSYIPIPSAIAIVVLLAMLWLLLQTLQRRTNPSKN